jgi:hypothetical protein
MKGQLYLEQIEKFKKKKFYFFLFRLGLLMGFWDISRNAQCTTKNKWCVTLWPCHLHVLKNILWKNKHYGNSNISPCKM